MTSQRSKRHVTYTASGLCRYEIKVWHTELNKIQVIRGDEKSIVEQKAEAKMRQWDEMWEKRQVAERKRRDREQKAIVKEEKLSHAKDQTSEALLELEKLGEILKYTLDIDDTIDWASLKNKDKFPEPKPKKPSPKKPEELPIPLPPEKEPQIPPPPDPKDRKYQPKYGFLDPFSKQKREEKKNLAFQEYRRDFEKWEKEKADILDRNKRDFEKWEEKKENILNLNKRALENYKKTLEEIEMQYKKNIKEWELRRQEFLRKQKEANKVIDAKKEKYLQKDSDAIFDYCEMVLGNSDYPDYFPQEYDIDYNPENNLLIVDYRLPPIDQIPTVEEVKYIQSRDEFVEKYISQSELNKLYDGILYQIALRTIHELYEADKVEALSSIVFNGHVRSTDPATGKEINACVLSVQANKDEFLEINLDLIDPKSVFKKLKGVGSSKLHSLVPIAPILKIDRVDKRFVSSYDVADNIDEGFNLAAMDWEDFEHLIRELFEKAFSAAGGEVKVTRASRDGGVDAVIFDPDPLRGGKIVVQAKRYTNVVGVSAVRDLYGTVVNEGANKGILVTTADYGPDAYEFAKGKPLQLLNGSNLLHLLEQHGHKARIDLKEAKKLLEEKDKEKGNTIHHYERR
jgi:restriction system protein